MFDSTQFRKPVPLPMPFQLKALGFEKPYDGAGKCWYNKKDKYIKFEWTETGKGTFLRLVIPSLASVLYGDNLTLIKSQNEIESIFDSINATVFDKTGIAFDVRTFEVARFDVCHHWLIEQYEVYERLHALRNAHVARMKRKPYEHGIYLQNDSEAILAYSKHAQMSDLARKRKATNAQVKMSVGMFRVERKFLNVRSCQRAANRLGVSNLAGELITANISDKLIDETIMSLKLNKHLESTDSRLALLRERYGFTPTYEKLVGFLTLCDEHGADNLVKLGYNAETFRRKRKQIEAAGAWQTTGTSKRTLSPLRVVRDSYIATDTKRVSVQL